MISQIAPPGIQMPLFTGRFDYSVDDKGRLSIPARLRDQIESAGSEASLIVTCLSPEYLSAYPPSQFQILIDKVGAAEDPRSREALRQLTSGAETCPVDKQGRIQIPENLRRRVGITRDVAILGVSLRIEIWDRAHYDAHLSAEQAGGTDLLSGLKAGAGLI